MRRVFKDIEGDSDSDSDDDKKEAKKEEEEDLQELFEEEDSTMYDNFCVNAEGEDII